MAGAASDMLTIHTDDNAVHSGSLCDFLLLLILTELGNNLWPCGAAKASCGGCLSKIRVRLN